MTEDYGEEVYNLLSKIVGLKFKSQINGSGIRLEKLFEMKNLVTGEEFFCLKTNKRAIEFNSPKEC